MRLAPKQDSRVRLVSLFSAKARLFFHPLGAPNTNAGAAQAANCASGGASGSHTHTFLKQKQQQQSSR